MSGTQHTSVATAIQLLTRAQNLANRPLRLTVRKFNPGGMSGHQTVAVQDIHGGIDWEGDQLIVVPANPLTELSAEDVAAIRESVSKGSSWHAYQSWKKVRDEADALKAQRDELVEALRIHHEWCMKNQPGYSDHGDDRVAYRATDLLIAKHKGASHE